MRLLALGLLSALVASSACTNTSKTGETAPNTVATYLDVDNLQPQTFTIYVTDGARRVRLGTAPPLRKTRLTIPRSVIFPAVQLQFLAQPQGTAPAPISELIAVSPGDIIGISIGP